jgi:uncharacterized membrane protein
MKLQSRILEHRIFRLGLIMKGVYGIVETALGVFLLSAGSRSLTRVVQFIFGYELIEDPNDFFGNLFMNIARNLSLQMHIFISLFLILHGLISIGIVMALVYKKRWVFPIVGTVLVLFIIYQLYQIVLTLSVFMIALTLIDMILLGLLKFEYDEKV